MDLGDFHDLVKTEANKGTRLDAKIPAAVRRAARWIERNHTLWYMERFVQFTLDPNAQFPRVAPLSDLVKAMDFVRIVDEDDEFTYLKRVDPQQVPKIGKGQPTKFWLDGHQWIWFNKEVEKETILETSFHQFTSWPTDTSAEHWLLDNAEDVLLGQTMVQLSPGAREPEWAQTYGSMLEVGLTTLLLADAEMRYHDKPAAMRYKPEFSDDPRLY